MIVIENPSRNTLGYVSYNEKDQEIAIVFRGTEGDPWDFENNQNWRTNIHAETVNHKDFPKCEVHSGFYSAYMAVSARVRGAVSTFKKKYRVSKMIVTGHSLGGALSVFAAMDIKKNGLATYNFNLYTFGQPRTGDLQWAS